MGGTRWVLLGRTALRSLLSTATSTSVRFSSTEAANGNLLRHLRPIEVQSLSKTLFHLDEAEVVSSDRKPSTQLSYAGFWNLVGRYATCLRKLGLKKGDRLAGQVSKRIGNYALFMGTLQVGGIYLPLNTDYTLSEIRYFLENAEPRLFICREQSLEEYLRIASSISGAGGVSVQVVTESDLGEMSLEAEASMEIAPVAKDDVASICYTSGTTGKPKGAMISHSNLLSNAKVLVETWKISRQDILLHALPIYHVHGLFVALNTLLLAGGSVVWLERFELDKVLAWLPKTNLMMGVPTYYIRLLSSPAFSPDLVKHFRLFIAGSAPLGAQAWENFKARSGGHRILERYGMTEGQMICSNPFEGERRAGTVGPPLPGVEARVRDGMLEYRGPNLFRGYWRMPEKTKAEFTEDGFFISGDLAEMDEKGYVRIMGRGKDLIISGGLNIYPKEIEDVLAQHSSVVESAVIGVPHPDFGEAVLAVVVLRNPLNSDEERAKKRKELVQFARQSLAGFKVPKRIFFKETLPRNSMGKVQKNVLREEFKNVLSS